MFKRVSNGKNVELDLKKVKQNKAARRRASLSIKRERPSLKKERSPAELRDVSHNEDVCGGGRDEGHDVLEDDDDEQDPVQDQIRQIHSQLGKVMARVSSFVLENIGVQAQLVGDAKETVH